MRHLTTAFLVLLIVSPLRADDDHCIGHRHGATLELDGRKFDPADGRDPRQYAPDRQVDFTHLRLDLRMPDPASKSFTCTETLTFKTLGRPIKRLGLDAVDLEITDVRDLAGVGLRFRHDGKRLTIDYAEELAPSTDAGVVIEYACKQPKDGMIFAIPDEAYRNRPLMVHTQGQTETNRHWFAAHDYPNERCTSEIAVTIPSKYKALANGKLVSKKEAGDGLTTWHYKLGHPHVSYLVSLVVGEFEVVTENWRGIPVEYWVPPGQQSGALRTFGKTPKMLDLFSRLSGVDYPYEKYAQSVVYLFGAGGMENTSTTTLHEMSVMDERAALDQELEGLVSHELAHQWYGDMITCNTWAHIWLNEGFATYFSHLWDEHERGADDYADGIWHTMRDVAAASGPDPTGGMVWFYYDNAWETFRRTGNNAYGKGASVLHMLRRSLGDELFFKCLAEYTRRFAWKQAESDDLRKVIEELSGRSYERFFQQWVYRSGAPDVKVSYEWDEDAGAARVTLEQRQEITEQSPAFAADVDVWLVDASGNVSQHVIAMDGRTSSGAFRSDAEPKQVVVDPHSAVLMKLELDLPAQMLIAQARQGPTTMSRYAAVGALGKLDRDASREALREILLDEKLHHSIRADAAAALGKMQTDAARAILLESLAESKAIADHKTRRATVAALGEYRHPAAAQTLLRFARRDASYAVETEATKALRRQDPSDEVVDALLANAKKPSWRDQIRTAAVEALGELGDERGVKAAMELAAYGQPFRSRSTGFDALGKLGRSVDGKQRDEIRQFLVEHMHDPQDRSARAAINALGASGDDRAVPELQRFADSSAPGELRDAARGAIDAINAKSGESTTVRGLRERIESLEKQRESQRRDGDVEAKAPATLPTTVPAR